MQWVQGLVRNLGRARRLRHALAREEPDAVISFIAETNVLVLLASVGLPFPVIVSERVDPGYHRIPTPWSVLRSLLYPRAAAVVVQGARILESLPPAVRRRARVIPNPVAPPDAGANPDASRGADAPGRRKRIVGLGRLARQKGFDLLVRAFAKVAPRFPDWELVIWGEGTERSALEALARSFDLAERVALPGLTRDPFREYAAAELFVLPSRYEGFPNALAEAMACGRPVIAADCRSGPAEIVRHGIDGLLVPPDDVKALADALTRLMGDAALRARLARNAVDVTRRFGVERIVGQWDDLLQEVSRN